MAAEKESKGGKTPQSAPPKQAGAQPKIVWDSTNLRSAYANVFNVAGAREEFVLLFGMNQAFDAGQQELKVQLTDRVVLSPFAAKRLSILLSNVIKDYEKRYGTLDIDSPQPDTASVQ
ncbi:DUF3467 domain-containing protein [Thermodesulfobacteriota bacterium]